MANGARPALDPQTETDILNEILALDWTTDVVTHPLRIIQSRLGIGEEQALRLFMSFQHRNLMICAAERTANNMAETGVISPAVRGRWIKPEEV